MIFIDPWISLMSDIGILCLIPTGRVKILISFVRVEKGRIIFVMGLSRHLGSIIFSEWPLQSASDDHLTQNSQSGILGEEKGTQGAPQEPVFSRHRRMKPNPTQREPSCRRLQSLGVNQQVIHTI